MIVRGLSVMLVAAALVVVTTANAGEFKTGIVGSGVDSATAVAAVTAAGGTTMRLNVNWATVAPTRPETPSDAEDPAYHWQALDQRVMRAERAGIDPLLDLVAPPSWVNTPAELLANLGLFAKAAAEHYSGATDLPRVRYWQVWNEPNLSTNLVPQLVDGKPVAPARYRAMVNAVADAVKSVHPDNLVVAGGLAPFRDLTPEVMKQNKDWGPLSFMRSMLCLSRALKPTCSTPARFDIWSTHPYTSGGPTHHAVLPDDVSLGDLPKMRRVLQAAVRAGHIQSRGPVKFWVTEFSWDSNPPDPKGVPVGLLKRWVPQALYVMWQSGVSTVEWYSVRDEPLTTSFYQSGLFFLSGKPKPYLEGFRFPLVAFPRPGGIYVWGRTPFGRSGRISVEVRNAGAWHSLGTVRTDQFGIFQHVFAAAPTGWVRGRLIGSGERTLPFSLTPVPDQWFNPFGGQALEPKHR